jgi:hypothetical protein
VLIGLTRWVSAGGVLVLAGRDDAFGPGGWAGSKPPVFQRAN